MRRLWLGVFLVACGGSPAGMPDSELPDSGSDVGRDTGLDAPDSGALADDFGEVGDARATTLASCMETTSESTASPGFAWGVAFAGPRTIWTGASGFSDVAAERAWTTEQGFRIGSVSKTFTAAMVLQLVDEGIVSLDDRLERWVPGYYDELGITVGHLITNTSGIVSYNYVGSFDESRSWTPDGLVEWAVMHEPALRFEPGSSWEYSNTNYVLLGKVVEAADARPFEESLQARLLDPLGLTQTYMDDGTLPDAHLVRNYRDGADVSEQYNPSLGWAAGGMVSTLRDLARWGVALYTGDVLSDSMRTLMVTPVSDLAGDYGHGSFVERDGDEALFGHTGGIGGLGTYMYYLQSADAVVIAMTNEIAAVDLRELAGAAWFGVLDLEH